ncbi:MAG: hypothetical protein [Caudoviricetes sp.]|nr:MAG: hypothetical protein [Caudoviricetes sp.]
MFKLILKLIVLFPLLGAISLCENNIDSSIHHAEENLLESSLYNKANVYVRDFSKGFNNIQNKLMENKCSIK